jgi:ABC-2 type transport system ATP-binding protein
MKRLASDGRSVLVSSHLLPEMALTASDLVVIGRGRLIAQCSTTQFVDSASQSSVRVSSRTVHELAAALRHRGIGFTTAADNDEALIVTGTDIVEVGAVAASAGVVLTELSVQRGSLEEAFMLITGHDVEYTAGVAVGPNNSPAFAAARR